MHPEGVPNVILQNRKRCWYYLRNKADRTPASCAQKTSQVFYKITRISHLDEKLKIIIKNIKVAIQRQVDLGLQQDTMEFLNDA